MPDEPMWTELTASPDQMGPWCHPSPDFGPKPLFVSRPLSPLPQPAQGHPPAQGIALRGSEEWGQGEKKLAAPAMGLFGGQTGALASSTASLPLQDDPFLGPGEIPGGELY